MKGKKKEKKKKGKNGGKRVSSGVVATVNMF